MLAITQLIVNWVMAVSLVPIYHKGWIIVVG